MCPRYAQCGCEPQWLRPWPGVGLSKGRGQSWRARPLASQGPLPGTTPSLLQPQGGVLLGGSQPVGVGWGGAGGEEVLTGHSSLQSLSQILEAAVSVGSRTLDIHLNSLLAALHAQVGRWRGL